MRELARRTAGANRLIGRDMNPYLLREARALARREGLLERIDFGEGRAEALPLPDGAVDVALSSTVFEEGDAELMLSEIVRVTRPGGRIGVIVRAIDMPFWVNLPLDPALKAKVDAPGIIGGGAAPKGVADMRLYSRLAALGLTGSNASRSSSRSCPARSASNAMNSRYLLRWRPPRRRNGTRRSPRPRPTAPSLSLKRITVRWVPSRVSASQFSRWREPSGKILTSRIYRRRRDYAPWRPGLRRCHPGPLPLSVPVPCAKGKQARTVLTAHHEGR